jgi:hypothetical protein
MQKQLFNNMHNHGADYDEENVSCWKVLESQQLYTLHSIRISVTRSKYMNEFYENQTKR